MTARYATFTPAVDARGITLNTLDADGVKTAAATPVALTRYAGAALDGAAITAGAFNGGVPRAINVTTGAAVATYNTTDPILIEGVEWRTGKAIVGQLLLTAANGGETIVGHTMFSPDHPITIVVPAQLLAGGTLEFGVNAATAISPPCHGIHVSATTGGTAVVAKFSRHAHHRPPVTLGVNAAEDYAWEVAELHPGTTATCLALWGTPQAVR